MASFSVWDTQFRRCESQPPHPSWSPARRRSEPAALNTTGHQAQTAPFRGSPLHHHHRMFIPPARRACGFSWGTPRQGPLADGDCGGAQRSKNNKSSIGEWRACSVRLPSSDSFQIDRCPPLVLA